MTELDGTPVRDAADLQLRLALLRIGEVAEFAVSRDGGFRSSAWVFRSSASRSARNALLVLMCGPSLRSDIWAIGHTGMSGGL